MKIVGRLGFSFWVTLFLSNLISFAVGRWNQDPWAFVNVVVVMVSLYYVTEHVEFK